MGVGEKIKTKYWTLQHTWWAFLALKQTFYSSHYSQKGTLKRRLKSGLTRLLLTSTIVKGDSQRVQSKGIVKGYSQRVWSKGAVKGYSQSVQSKGIVKGFSQRV